MPVTRQTYNYVVDVILVGMFVDTTNGRICAILDMTEDQSIELMHTGRTVSMLVYKLILQLIFNELFI